MVLILGLAGLAVGHAGAQSPQLTGPAPLVPHYMEASNGLGFPTWDGGSSELEFGDVDGNGHLDFVSVGDHGSPFIGTNMHGIVVWRGDGAGNFSAVQSGDFGYGGCALGDADGDGLLDVAYGVHHNYSGGDFGDQLIEVALGDGSGAAWTPWDDGLASAGETYGMFDCDFGDVDDDGDLDLACLSFGCCNGWRVYLNGGDGTWTPRFQVTGGNTRNGIVFGDVNGDGRLDLAVGHQSGTVWLGDGSGGFHNGDRNLPPPGPLGRSGTDLGDVNGDGRADLVYSAGGGLHLWLATAGGTWQAAGAGLPAGGGYERADLADMNRDGRLDLCAFGDGRLGVWLGDGLGSFLRIANLNTPRPGTAAALRAGGDVDHNGMADILVLADEGGAFNSRNRLHCFRERSVPRTPAVAVASPGRGEAWPRGGRRVVRWTAADPTRAGTVEVDWSDSGLGGPWHSLAAGMPDSSALEWVVDGNPSTDARLRVTLSTAAGVVSASSPPFTIL